MKLPKSVEEYITTRIQRYSTEASKYEGGVGIPVGTAGIEFRWKEAILYALKAAVKLDGVALKDVKDELVKYGKFLVRVHNARRPKDINWSRWEESNDHFIESTMREIAELVSKST